MPQPDFLLIGALRYLGLFDGGTGQKAIGKASALYLSSYSPEMAAARIQRRRPDARPGAVTREPFRFLGVDGNVAVEVRRPYELPPLMDTRDKAMLLNNACRWLGEMVVVGITERYAESVLLACQALGVVAPAGLPRKNVNPQRSDLTARYRSGLAPNVVARLEELTQYDRQLYAHAQDLFLEQWARYRARPRRTYSVGPRARNVVSSVRRALRPLRGLARRMTGDSVP